MRFFKKSAPKELARELFDTYLCIMHKILLEISTKILHLKNTEIFP